MRQLIAIGMLMTTACAPPISSPDLSQYTKWVRVMNAPEREKTDLLAQHLFTGTQGMRQLELVNKYYNGRPYVPDKVNWGADDYWATPRQFAKRGGDCEDYAIAKFYLLSRLGVAKGGMQILTVKDSSKGGYLHSILTVELDGETYALDSERDEVEPLSSLSQYTKLFSINESGWVGYKLLTN